MTDPWARLGGELQPVPRPTTVARFAAFFRSRTGVFVVLSVLAFVGAVWTLVVADRPPARDANGHVSGTAELRLDDLEPGDCIPDISSEETYTLAVGPCDVAHAAQVIQRASLKDREYPGEDVLKARIERRCELALVAFSGSKSDYDVLFYYPQAVGWSDGQRGYVCLLVTKDGSSLTASVRQTA